MSSGQHIKTLKNRNNILLVCLYGNKIQHGYFAWIYIDKNFKEIKKGPREKYLF